MVMIRNIHTAVPGSGIVTRNFDPNILFTSPTRSNSDNRSIAQALTGTNATPTTIPNPTKAPPDQVPERREKPNPTDLPGRIPEDPDENPHTPDINPGQDPCRME